MSNNKKTNDPHDTRLKELFRNKKAFISLLKDCVKEDWINDLDEDSLRLSNTSYILQDFKKKEADIVYEATLNNGKQRVVFYLLLEIQSEVDYRMPYRLLLYIVEILRFYYNNSDANERESKDIKFPAVFPIVFFSGKDTWTVPLNIKDMFDSPLDFGDYILNFNYM
ncbi:MAG: Rpn family recombination-promoting nuclease/putative transposase, partial [Bacteroidales bacterium]|nr:Rpn family recombination-promoting nuclease/putative transposase [Bacteroidales bacterium]